MQLATHKSFTNQFSLLFQLKNLVLHENRTKNRHMKEILLVSSHHTDVVGEEE